MAEQEASSSDVGFTKPFGSDEERDQHWACADFANAIQDYGFEAMIGKLAQYVSDEDHLESLKSIIRTKN